MRGREWHHSHATLNISFRMTGRVPRGNPFFQLPQPPAPSLRGPMRRRTLALAFTLTAVLAGSSFAQRVDPSLAKPGRDPNQPIDEEYTKKIKEYTTETFFLSPLVDYLPAAKGIPTPKATLGDIAGAPGKLPYSKEVYDYMRLLAKSTPRVKVYSMGTTEEGREMIA